MADPALAGDTKKYEDTMNRYALRSEWFREHGGYEMEAKIRGILSGMGFKEMSYDSKVNSLSGGQKTRLALAKMLLQAPDLLILDEPTNHLDIATLTWLEGYLRGYSGAILVVSHDRYFLDALVEAFMKSNGPIPSVIRGIIPGTSISRKPSTSPAEAIRETAGPDRQNGGFCPEEYRPGLYHQACTEPPQGA